MMEPPEGRPALDIRAQRFAKRMKPWLSSQDGKWMKATLAKEPNQIIGHAGWLVPRPHHILHHWRHDAAEKLGWKDQEGWTDKEVKELWAHVDLKGWNDNFEKFDAVREDIMTGEPHWFLAPLWVLPEFQGRGVSTLLLKDVLDIADAQDPAIPIYLESVPEARKIYEHFGFEGFEDVPPGDGRELVMIRRGQKKAKKLAD